MTRLWLFLHLLGFVLWMGGAFASMVAAIASRREERSALGAVVRAQGALHRILIGPGALLTVLTGLMLTFRVQANSIAGANVWLILMQGAGVVGALLALFISVPTAAKLTRLDPVGQTAAYFDELRQRQRIIGSIAGTLGLAALLGGAMTRFAWG